MMQPNFNQGFNQQQQWNPQRQQQPQQPQQQQPFQQQQQQMWKQPQQNPNDMQVGIPVIRDPNSPQRPMPQQPSMPNQQRPSSGWQGGAQDSGPQGGLQPDINQNLYNAFQLWSNNNWYGQQNQSRDISKSPGKGKSSKRNRVKGLSQRYNSWDDLNEIFSTFRPRVEGSF